MTEISDSAVSVCVKPFVVYSADILTHLRHLLSPVSRINSCVNQRYFSFKNQFSFQLLLRLMCSDSRLYFIFVLQKKISVFLFVSVNEYNTGVNRASRLAGSNDTHIAVFTRQTSLRCVNGETKSWSSLHLLPASAAATDVPSSVRLQNLPRLADLLTAGTLLLDIHWLTLLTY